MPASGSVDQVEVPAAVLEVSAGRTLRPVWQNEVGGLSFKMTGDGATVFVKWQPAGTSVDLGAEAVRMEWARPVDARPESHRLRGGRERCVVGHHRGTGAVRSCGPVAGIRRQRCERSARGCARSIVRSRSKAAGSPGRLRSG